MIIGRNTECDLVLDSPLVSRRHAELVDGELRDLGSSNGTFVEGRRVEQVHLEPGQVVYIGSSRLYFDGTGLREIGNRGEVEIRVRNLTFQPPGCPRPLLNDLTFTVKPGEFTALVGTSGAGKSTLMSCLSGQNPPTTGEVLLNGLSASRNLALFRPLIGWVPQDDIVHRELPVEAALWYAARLRLPPDTSPAEVRHRIDLVLASMELTHRRGASIHTLSGGERKRVSIAVELLTEPGLFFLDEPTSGLDPGLEKKAMQLMSRLSRQGRTVVLVTHATHNIVLCDKICFMAPGGRMVFYGPPVEALKFFEVDDFADIYLKVGDRELAAMWEERFRGSRGTAHASQETTPPEPADERKGLVRKTAEGIRQFGVLTARYAHLLVRDRTNLALLVLQAPAVGAILSFLFEKDLFALNQEFGRGGKFAIQEGPTLLFMMLVSSIFFGAINSCREIVKESSIFRRERLVNLQLTPYVTSKLVVLSAIGLLQCGILLAAVLARIDLGLSPADLWDAYLFLFGGYVGGVALGLMLSALCSSAEQATTLVSVVLILQLVLSGAFVKPEQMAGPIAYLSALTVSRWCFAGLGSIANLNSRFQELGLGWITGDFYLTPIEVWKVLLPLLGLHLAVVFLALRWRERS